MSDSKKSNKPSIVQKPRDTSWEKAALWYDDLLESGDGTYQSDLILPNVLRLLELKKGEKVLDLRCGQGFFSREFYKAGADVSGIDLSPKLISLAKEKSSTAIKFGVSSADSLPFFSEASFETVVCVLAIQNMKNVAGVLREVSRVLKTNARLLIVMNHPSFRVPKRSAWGYDEAKKFNIVGLMNIFPNQNPPL